MVEEERIEWVCVWVDEEMKMVKNGGGGVGQDVYKGEEGAVWFLLISKLKVIYRRITIIPTLNSNSINQAFNSFNLHNILNSIKPL